MDNPKGTSAGKRPSIPSSAGKRNSIKVNDKKEKILPSTTTRINEQRTVNPSPSPYFKLAREDITPLPSVQAMPQMVPGLQPPVKPDAATERSIWAKLFSSKNKKEKIKETRTSLPKVKNDSKKDKNSQSTFLTDYEIARLGQRFKKLDSDSNGTISLAEFRAIPELHANPLVDRVVEIFDVDKNGEVDFKEFIHGMSQFVYSTNSEAKQRLAFRIFDMDNNGYISPGELFQVLQAMCGSNLTDIQLQQLIDHTFMMCDKDNDGRITFQDFCQATKNSDAHKRMMIDKVFL